MVSVVIATYRREQSLYNALESLVKQTYKDFEVVLVDDNAVKEWNERIKKLVSTFCSRLQINYIQNEDNQGSAKTRNIGISASRGEYVTFLDDDDLYMPQKIETQVQQMILERADYSLMNLALYNEDESLSEIRKRDYLLSNEAHNLMICHLKYHMTGTDTMMFRRDYLLSFGGFESIDVGDEFYLMMRAIEHKGHFVYCNSCDVKAYVHIGEEGLSSGVSKINGENALFRFKKHYFAHLRIKDVRYIKMRHYAVLAFAYRRMHKIGRFFLEGIKSFLCSPLDCIKLLKGLRD